MYMYVQKETIPDSMKSYMLSRASFLFPDSEIYCMLGDESMNMGNLDKAEILYRKAIDMVPSRITPRYKLFKLYISRGDTILAVSLGRIVLSLKPKVESTKTLRMKGEIKDFLQDSIGFK